MENLTTTSYAILALLGVRPWTTYQLAQQMGRSVGHMWPRAASVVYEEPKRLARLGLVEATKEYNGQRASTVYSITDPGRRELAAWLDRPGDGPTTEFEALLKVAFADNGSLAALRTNLAAIASHADLELESVHTRMREYAETGGPHPDRLPVIALVVNYYLEMNLALKRWVEWAEQATNDWSGLTAGDGATVPADAFSHSADESNDGGRHT